METTARLQDLLDALANGSAEMAIEDAFEALYPVSYDPETGVLVEADLN